MSNKKGRVSQCLSLSFPLNFFFFFLFFRNILLSKPSLDDCVGLWNGVDWMVGFLFFPTFRVFCFVFSSLIIF